MAHTRTKNDFNNNNPEIRATLHALRRLAPSSFCQNFLEATTITLDFSQSSNQVSFALTIPGYSLGVQRPLDVQMPKDENSFITYSGVTLEGGQARYFSHAYYISTNPGQHTQAKKILEAVIELAHQKFTIE